MAKASFRSSLQKTADNELDLDIDESSGGYPSDELGGAHQSPILVLSRYSALIDTVRKAAPRGVPVVQATDLDHAAEKMPSLRPGVLVADTASISDVARMVAQLTQQFPDLVVVVAGQREDSAALMQLTTSAQFFRFLLVPLSHGQTRLTLEAAIAQHRRLITPSMQIEESSVEEEDEKRTNVVGYAAFAVGLVVLLAGAGWFVSRMTSGPDAPAARATTVAPPPSVTASRPDPLQAELDRAREAFARGKYDEPVGASALDYYRSALSIDRNSTAAQEGIRRVADKVLERAEAALMLEKFEEAINAIEVARDIDPQHPRLAFFDALVAPERTKLSKPEDESRKVDALVAKARDLRSQGRLTLPQGGSARDALLEAKRLDPSNPQVAQGLIDLSMALADEANRAIEIGNLDKAQSLLASARQLDSAGPTSEAVEKALADARNRAAVNRQAPATPPAKAPPQAPALVTKPAKDAGKGMVADIRRMLNEGKLIDPKGDNAKDALAMLRATDPARAEIGELASTLSSRLLESGKQALTAKELDRSQQLLSAARDVGVPANDAAISQAERELAAAARTNTTNTTNTTSSRGEEGGVVQAASLRQTKMVEPVYPAAARRRNEKGSVELAFTVTPDGGVEDVEVRKSNPALVFDAAAKKAVEQWRFEPVLVNGQAVSQRAVVRLMFSMD